MRKTLTTIHVVLAAFFLPMGLLYAITGGLYTWGVTGSSTATSYDVVLAAPLSPELSSLAAVVEPELARHSLATPSGEARVRKSGASYYFEWTGTRRDVQLHPTADPQMATLKVTESGKHRFFVQLHKAKGGVAFKVLAAIWAIGLVGLMISGGFIAWMSPPFRRLAVVTGLLGIGTFGVVALLS